MVDSLPPKHPWPQPLRIAVLLVAAGLGAWLVVSVQQRATSPSAASHSPGGPPAPAGPSEPHASTQLRVSPIPLAGSTPPAAAQPAVSPALAPPLPGAAQAELPASSNAGAPATQAASGPTPDVVEPQAPAPPQPVFLHSSKFFDPGSLTAPANPAPRTTPEP